jgi:hypothetical protein
MIFLNGEIIKSENYSTNKVISTNKGNLCSVLLFTGQSKTSIFVTTERE